MRGRWALRGRPTGVHRAAGGTKAPEIEGAEPRGAMAWIPLDVTDVVHRKMPLLVRARNIIVFIYF
jgi:hypothetical protein